MCFGSATYHFSSVNEGLFLPQNDIFLVRYVNTSKVKDVDAIKNISEAVLASKRHEKGDPTHAERHA